MAFTKFGDVEVSIGYSGTTVGQAQFLVFNYQCMNHLCICRWKLLVKMPYKVYAVYIRFTLCSSSWGKSFSKILFQPLHLMCHDCITNYGIVKKFKLLKSCSRGQGILTWLS